jgi:hypothetical protein
MVDIGRFSGLEGLFETWEKTHTWGLIISTLAIPSPRTSHQFVANLEVRHQVACLAKLTAWTRLD